MDSLDFIAIARRAALTLASDGRNNEADELSDAIGRLKYVMQALRSRALYVRDERNDQAMRQMAADVLAIEVMRATAPRPSSDVAAFHDVRPVEVAK